VEKRNKMNFKVTVLLVILLTVLGIALAQQLSYDESCQVLEGSGVRVDQCDGTKFLVCKDGRCQCSDPVNQVYTYREELISSRSRRSPGKGGKGFKKVAIGAGAGVVAGVATYQVAKNADKFGKGFTTERPSKYRKVFSCYSRVGGQCALNYNNWESVGSTSSSTTTSTTTEAVANTSTDASNSTTTLDASTVGNSTEAINTTTTTTAAPSSSAAPQTDISKITKCVPNSVCNSASPSGGNGTSSFLQKVNFDPRIGTCKCGDGYRRTTRDLCEKVKSGATKTAGISGAMILVSLILSKFLAF